MCYQWWLPRAAITDMESAYTKNLLEKMYTQKDANKILQSLA